MAASTTLFASQTVFVPELNMTFHIHFEPLTREQFQYVENFIKEREKATIIATQKSEELYEIFKSVKQVFENVETITNKIGLLISSFKNMLETKLIKPSFLPQTKKILDEIGAIMAGDKGKFPKFDEGLKKFLTDKDVSNYAQGIQRYAKDVNVGYTKMVVAYQGLVTAAQQVSAHVKKQIAARPPAGQPPAPTSTSTPTLTTPTLK